MAKECMNCGDEVDRLYADISNPPLEIRPCICADCIEGILHEEIERIVNEVYSDFARTGDKERMESLEKAYPEVVWK